MSVLCTAGATYTLEFSLEDQGNAGLWVANPTIAAADFQVSANGGAFGNVDNIPTVTPAAGRRVALVLSAAETTAAGAGGLLYVAGVDAVGDEWYDIGITVRVHAATGDAALTGDAMTLANDAITAAKIAANAIGASEIATDAIGAAELAATATAEIAAANWANSERTLTQSGAEVAAAVAGVLITIQRGDSLSISLTGLGNISTRTLLWFTLKRSLSDADSASIIQIEETAGLMYINGAAGTAGNGVITVTDAVVGNATITLQEADTDDLVAALGLYWDVQWSDGTTVTTARVGPGNIVDDVTRAIA